MKKLTLIETADFTDTKMPWIAVRKDGMNLNASAAIKMNLHSFKFCRFHRFNNESLENVSKLFVEPNNLTKSISNFRFTEDFRRHERKKKGARYLPCRNFIRLIPQLVRITKFDSNWEKRLELHFDAEQNMHFVNIIPNFEVSVKVDGLIPEISCIYSLYQNSQNGNPPVLVNIGESGNLKRRTQQHLNDDEWVFDFLEYSPLDKNNRIFWEKFYLDKYKSENNGRLPLFNKIGGKKYQEKQSTETLFVVSNNNEEVAS